LKSEFDTLRVIIFLLLASILFAIFLLPKAFSWLEVFQRLIFLFILMGCLYISVFQFADAPQRSVEQTVVSKTNNQKIVVFAAFLICVLIANLIIIIRFAKLPNPQGFDTPYYVYGLRSIYLGEISSDLFYHPLVTVMMLPLAYFFGGNPVSIGIGLPFVIGSFFASAIFVGSYLLKRSVAFASLAAIFSVSSFFFVRLTYDLYSQTIFIAFFYLLLVAFTKFLGIHDQSEVDKRKRYFMIIGILSIALFSIDPTSAVIVFLFFVLFLTLNGHHRAKLRGIDRHVLKIIALIAFSVAVIASFSFVSGLAQKFFELYANIINNELSIFQPRANWDWVVYLQTWPIMILCAVSVGYFSMKKYEAVNKDFVKLLGFWMTYLLFLILMTGYSQSYRLILFMPFSLIAAIGVYSLLSQRVFSRSFLKLYKINWAIGLSLMIIVIIAIVPSAFLQGYQYFPENASQLSDLGSKYGSNPYTYYLVSQQIDFSPYWYNVYLGKNVFIGNSNQFLSSNVSVSKIIVDQQFFNVDSFIRLISDPLGDGVYSLNRTYLQASPEELEQRWEGAMSNIHTDSPANDAKFIVWGDIDVVRNVNNSAVLFMNDSSLGTLIGGGTDVLSEPIEANCMLLLYGGNFTSDINLEFYANGTFVSGIKLQRLFVNQNIATASIEKTILFDEYRVVLVGFGRNITENLKLDLVSFGTFK
jgi:hypothetical protein